MDTHLEIIPMINVPRYFSSFWTVFGNFYGTIFRRNFEFNSYMLEFIGDHVFSCKYGTFLYDHQFDREENNLASRTVSLWSHINDDKERLFMNHFYIEDPAVLYPDHRLRRFKVWHYYDRLNQKSETETVYKHASAYVSLQTAQAETKIKWLTDKLEEEKKKNDDFHKHKGELSKSARDSEKKYLESLAKQDKLFQEVVGLNEQKKEFDRERHKSSKRQEMLFEEVLYLRQKMQKMQGSKQGVLSPSSADGSTNSRNRRRSRQLESKSSGDISSVDPERLKELLHSSDSRRTSSNASNSSTSSSSSRNRPTPTPPSSPPSSSQPSTPAQGRKHTLPSCFSSNGAHPTPTSSRSTPNSGIKFIRNYEKVKKM
eukprot:TRINITY_DN612_c0_g1_i1.p1 TRINITY_DN612_c0_g1~~TRINITY_DN612_c0_g1_i1.p1  ORF type:complete len:371 (+),score=69.54 TRINITY_DN612_c0_g1_i1:176-1288(+)